MHSRCGCRRHLRRRGRLCVRLTVGVCNGPGAIFDCGCSGVPESDCDCNGNVLDECGICSPGPAFECGYEHSSGDCDCNGNELDAIGVCGGSCAQTWTKTAFATTRTVAWARWTPAAFATVPARFTSAAVRTSPPETATATATSPTLWACVVGLVPKTSTATASATMWTGALACGCHRRMQRRVLV